MNTVREVFAVAVVALCMMVGCGGAGVDANALPGNPGGASPARQSLDVTPTQVEVEPTGQLDFAATAAVVWQVNEPQGGSLDSSGTYTAPQAEGTYHVVATRLDGTNSATAQVVVRQGAARVTVSPATPGLTAGGTATFTADAVGVSGASVVWSVREGAAGGAITGDGVYTAPASAGTYHVVATTTGTPSRMGTAVVTVSAPTANAANVRDFGAVGDGVTDDTGAFRAAAATGKDLFIPATSAHFKLTGRVIVQGSVRGDGSMPEIRMYGADGGRDNQHVIFEIDDYAGSGAVFSGLKLNGQWDGGTNGEWSHLIQIIHSQNITVEGNILLNAYGDSVLIGGETSPYPSENVVVRNNTIDTMRRCAVAVVAARNVTIDGNTIKKWNDYVSAIDAEPNPNNNDVDSGIVISNNDFESPNAIAVMTYTFPNNSLPSGNVTVTGNTSKGFKFFAKPYNTGTWSQITLTNNKVTGPFADVIAPVSQVRIEGNQIAAPSGSDTLNGVTTLLNNVWTASGGYAVNLSSSPGAQVSGNQFNGVTSQLNP